MGPPRVAYRRWCTLVNVLGLRTWTLLRELLFSSTEKQWVRLLTDTLSLLLGHDVSVQGVTGWALLGLRLQSWECGCLVLLA